MRRRRYPNESAAAEHDAAAASVSKFVERRKPPRKKRAPAPRVLKKAYAECETRRESDDWVGAKPAHFVALYVWCHTKIYGVAPAELEGFEWWAATRAAETLLEKEFGNDPYSLVDFMKWCWREESRREKWRKEHKTEGGRLTWQAQFRPAGRMTEYRIQKMRSQ